MCMADPKEHVNLNMGKERGFKGKNIASTQENVTSIFVKDI